MQKSRRKFVKTAIGSTLLTATAPGLLNAAADQTIVLQPDRDLRSYAANDQINVGIIGMGIMGFNNARTTSAIPGVRLTAVCDLYSGRLARAREVFGKELITTRNYKEILSRPDIDAVIVATSDHWHDRIAIDAMKMGKHVYLEKPMVHHLDEGAAVIATQQETGKLCQIGSQRVSSIVTQHARMLFQSQIIGQLILAETWMDRHSSNGAWQYAIPTDASANTVDWKAFLGDAQEVDFDPVRFFRWRNYRDYGTGIAGDLFVHLFSALHTITGSNGPERIYASGGLRYWNDGRDVPDICLGIYDYPKSGAHPAFNLQMRVNFVDGAELGEGLRLIGTDGVMTVGWNSIKITRNKISSRPTYGGWDSFDTFTEAQQKEFVKWYDAQYPAQQPEIEGPDMEYKAPEGYSANTDHHLNFYMSIRENRQRVEDALFGMRAAGPALASNVSYFEKRIVNWNPETCIQT